MKKYKSDKEHMSLEELIRSGYKEAGDILCPAHDVDHAILYEEPKTGNVKTYCPQDDMTV